MKLLLIGRSAHADVVIPDASVSAYHAEVVVTADGRCHVSDRASAQGTYHRVSATDPWTPVRQIFVEMSDQLRLGDYVCGVADLLGGVLDAAPSGRQPGRSGDESGAEAMQPGGVTRGLPRGAVERDPVTGEIVRRRF
jgi:hypothetical protein